MLHATYTSTPGQTSPIQWTGKSCFVQILSLVLFNLAHLFSRSSLISFCRFKSAKGTPHPDTRWEAYSFELIPYNAHYTMLQSDFLNGDRPNPAPLPPTYSWDDDKSVSFDPTTTWGSLNLQRWSTWEQSLAAERSTSGAFSRLLNLDAGAEYERMLTDARCKVGDAAQQQRTAPLPPLYRVYPVGVALTRGDFTVDWSSSYYLNGGSNLNYFSSHHENAPTRKFEVHVPFPPSSPNHLSTSPPLLPMRSSDRAVCALDHPQLQANRLWFLPFFPCPCSMLFLPTFCFNLHVCSFSEARC